MFSSVLFAPNAIKCFQREQLTRINQIRDEAGKEPDNSTVGLIHWTFENQVPKEYRIFLAGPLMRW